MDAGHAEGAAAHPPAQPGLPLLCILPGAISALSCRTQLHLSPESGTSCAETACKAQDLLAG